MTRVAALDLKLRRVEQTASFTLQAPVEVAFPLFGPMKEKLWAPGWDPEIVYSTTHEVEEQMIFRTPAMFGESELYTWVITQYRPDDYFVVYTVFTTQRIWFISVRCVPKGMETNVSITYSYTGLTPNGNELNEIALQKMFEHNLTDWQEAIHYYLNTGKTITHIT